MKRARRSKGGVDDRLRYAVTRDIGEPDLLQRLDRLRGQDPRVLGLLGPFPQHRKQFADRGDDRFSDLLAHRLLLPSGACTGP